AIEVYKQAVLLKPNSADAYNYLGVALKDQGKLDEAIASFNKALSLKPDYAEAYNNMGNVLKKQGKLEETISSYNKALSFRPDYADAYNNMGVALQDQGKFEEAISSYNKALSFKPDYAEAHRHLSSLIKYKPDCTQVALVAEIIERTDLKEDDRCHLHYTFAKMTEDLGDLDTAYENYVAGGKLRQKLLSYDFKQDELRFEQIKNTAPKLKEFAFKKPIKATTNTPIFILGMPRSGTTLVEQIISSHSQVRGAGELPFLGRFGSSLCYGNQIINLENILKMRNAYLNELIKVSNECPFVTDKMPQNFLFIGLLLKALPEAKVIHVKRDPAATCWSNFKQHFSAKGLGYSYNLKDTVKYFKLYQDLMQFWDEQYSEYIYHLDYDKLTIEQEPETRKLIEYLKLGWEDDCLSPHKNKRSVRTASQQQVREKVYTGSSQAWRKFEPYLNGVFDEIEPSSAPPLI
ncbi:tetratricopeptide repeat protein, partial [Rhodobacteraceae bacterium]|nr:tetratricopeptide repeat protein [Paracoccaceae bacterium]